MPRVRLCALVASAALLAAPAAHAEEVPVPVNGLQAAVDAGNAGDVLKLAAGDHTEPVTIPAGKPGLTIDGAAGARLTGPLTVQAATTVLRTVALAPATDGLTVGATGEVTLAKVLATRTAGGDVPVVTSAGTLRLEDTTVLTTTGDGVAVTGPATTIVRSTVFTTEAASDAVTASNSAAGDHALLSDSSVFVGGAGSGAGIRATTSGTSIILPPPLGFTVGPLNLALRHVTIAGASRGLALASGAGLAGGGITAAVAGSIVHPASTVTSSQAGGAPATLSSTDSDGPGLQQDTPDAQLFAASYRLRADAPAIGKGGPLADGESTTDVDGQPRTSPTDIGADQFVNGAPTTGLALSSGVVDEGATVTAALTPSDPDVGDRVSVYAIDWGDGTQSIGQAPTATHVYARSGTYVVRGAVADARNTPSGIATASVTVRDQSAPALTIGSPKDGATLRFKRNRRLTLKGTDTDATGVAKVEVALTRKAGRRCYQYGTRFVRKACSKLTFKRATLRDTAWSLRTRKGVVLRRGTYTLRVRALDGAGNRTSGFRRSAGTLVRFRVR